MTCCCSLAGTIACATCNSRRGVFGDWNLRHGFIGISPEWKRQQNQIEENRYKKTLEEAKQKYAELIKKTQDVPDDIQEIINDNFYKLVETECPACNGTKIQERKSDGLKVLCPACEGKGKI